MPPSRRMRLGVVLLVLSLVVAPPAVGSEPRSPEPPGPWSDGLARAGVQQGSGGPSMQAVDPDSVRMAIALQPDGDARWTVTYRVRLENDNETAAFESVREDVAADPGNYTGRFGERMRTTVAAAANATDREMAVRNVTVDARVQEFGQTYGILEYTFEWTNFAVVENDRITAGDALAGLFLDDQTTLVVSWPTGYELVDARPVPDDDVGDEHSAGWAGPDEFGANEPRVVVEPRADGPLADLPGGAILGVGLLALAGVGSAVLWSRRRGAATGPGGAGDGGAAAGDADSAGAAGDEPPMELLSNEEKVMKVVRDGGGRVKQQEIVEALDWTEAKTSQVVRDLRDDGSLEGFRLGRENVLRLPEADDEEV